MHKYFSILFFCIFTVSYVFSQDIYFNTHPTIWKDGDYLIWTTDDDPVIDPKEFCLSLKRNNSSIGDPKCRLIGEWIRDSVSTRYANWLNANMDPNLPAEYLKPRHPAMLAKLQSLEDKIVIFVNKNKEIVNIALFDETTSEPVSAGSILLSPDKVSMGDAIASAFFSRNAQRRLSKTERTKRQTEPNEIYQEVPLFKGWFGIGSGYSQAQIPLTPDSWYKSHVNSQVKNYRVTKDSTSLWNFIDDSDPYFTLYAGATWYDFIGIELIYHYAKHHVKTDPTDTVYQELDHWNFSQHEIGLSAMLSKNYKPASWLNITPFIYIGFQYSFFVEDIALKDDIKTPSKAYQVRLEFEDAYKGALFGIGSHFILFNHYGLGIRTGISSRGRDTYVDPSPDAAAESTIIGGSTIDWYIGFGLEYHFSRL